jgi:hypothetical protein
LIARESTREASASGRKPPSSLMVSLPPSRCPYPAM